MGSCQYQAVLQVTPPQTPISSASLELSSACLGCLEDVTWPTLEKFLPRLFSKPCIVFYYRCLKIVLLSCHGSVFFFFSCLSCRQTALPSSNKMSPHKMNKSERRRVYQTSHQALCFEPGTRKNTEKLFTTYALRHAPSAPISCFHP